MGQGTIAPNLLLVQGPVMAGDSFSHRKEYSWKQNGVAPQASMNRNVLRHDFFFKLCLFSRSCVWDPLERGLSIEKLHSLRDNWGWRHREEEPFIHLGLGGGGGLHDRQGHSCEQWGGREEVNSAEWSRGRKLVSSLHLLGQNPDLWENPGGRVSLGRCLFWAPPGQDRSALASPLDFWVEARVNVVARMRLMCHPKPP